MPCAPAVAVVPIVAQPPIGPHRRFGVEKFRKRDSSRHAHSLGLGRSAAGDLLDTELVKLGLQLVELLGELLLVLAPELTSLDLGRLYKSISDEFSRYFGKRSDGERTMVAALLCVLSALRIEDCPLGSNCDCGTRAKRVGRTRRARDDYCLPEVSGGDESQAPGHQQYCRIWLARRALTSFACPCFWNVRG